MKTKPRKRVSAPQAAWDWRAKHFGTEMPKQLGMLEEAFLAGVRWQKRRGQLRGSQP